MITAVVRRMALANTPGCVCLSVVMGGDVVEKIAFGEFDIPFHTADAMDLLEWFQVCREEGRTVQVEGEWDEEENGIRDPTFRLVP